MKRRGRGRSWRATQPSALDSVKDRLVLSVARLAVKAHSFMKGRHTRKTSAFVKACLAYCHITIPSIDSFFTRLQLQLLCGEVALLNSCLPQTDTFFKGAISLIPDVPASEEIDYKMVATEPKLVAFIKQFCAALVMVPGHPQHGPFYLVRGLLNAVQRVEWNPASGGRAEVSLAVLGAMCVFAQSKFPYKCVGVDANDTLYGGRLPPACSPCAGDGDAALPPPYTDDAAGTYSTNLKT